MTNAEIFAMCVDACELARKHIRFTGTVCDVYTLPVAISLSDEPEDDPPTILRMALLAASRGGRPWVCMRDEHTLEFHHY